MTELEIRGEEHAAGEILLLQGELDLTNTHLLGAALEGTTARRVVLDLGLLAFVDSAGIRAVDDAHRLLDIEDRQLLVVAPSGSRAEWTFRVAGFAPEMVLATIDAALAHSR